MCTHVEHPGFGPAASSMMASSLSRTIRFDEVRVDHKPSRLALSASHSESVPASVDEAAIGYARQRMAARHRRINLLRLRRLDDREARTTLSIDDIGSAAVATSAVTDVNDGRDDLAFADHMRSSEGNVFVATPASAVRQILREVSRRVQSPQYQACANAATEDRSGVSHERVNPRMESIRFSIEDMLSSKGFRWPSCADAASILRRYDHTWSDSDLFTLARWDPAMDDV